MSIKWGVASLSSLILGTLLLFEALGLSPESQRRKAEALQKLEKYDLMDFGAIKDYQGLKQVGDEIFGMINELMGQRPGAAYEVWKERGAMIQKRLADRADNLASLLRSEINGKTASDRFKSSEVIRTLLLAAQARRWADYVIQNMEKVPEEIWVSEYRQAGNPLKSPRGNVWEISPQDRIHEEVLLGDSIYNNVWQIYFSKMMEVAGITEDRGSLQSMLSWLEQFKKSKLDSNGKSRMYEVHYYDLKTGSRQMNVTLLFKMLPDSEKEELDRVIARIQDELKAAQIKLKEREAQGPCKKTGEELPTLDEWREELRCADVAL